MTVFSRAFVRKRVISLATTASVAAISLAFAHGPTSAYHLRGTMPVQYVADRPDYYNEQQFQLKNDIALNKTIADMTVKPAGEVDRDFVAMMVPHHQGAADMAGAFLRDGPNQKLRRMAQQQREIPAMLVVGEPLPPSAASPMQPVPSSMNAALDSVAMKMK